MVSDDEWPVFEVGDLCRCLDDEVCEFVPGSIVEVVELATALTSVRVRLVFGDYKTEEEDDGIGWVGPDGDGAVYCWNRELELIRRAHTCS
jgi:hypothetical protein